MSLEDYNVFHMCVERYNIFHIKLVMKFHYLVIVISVMMISLTFLYSHYTIYGEIGVTVNRLVNSFLANCQQFV